VFDDVRDNPKAHIDELKKKDPEAESEENKQRVVNEN